MHEEVGLGLRQQVGDRREPAGQAVRHPAELLGRGVFVGCAKMLRMAEATMLAAVRGTSA